MTATAPDPKAVGPSTKAVRGVDLHKRAERYGFSLMKLDRLMGDRRRAGQMRMTEIRVKKPRPGGAEYLVVVKGEVKGKRVVGFASALDPSDAIRLAIEKVDNATMKVRPDKPYEPQA